MRAVTVTAVYGVRVPNTTRPDHTRRLAAGDDGKYYPVLLGSCPLARGALVIASSRRRPINFIMQPTMVLLPLADAIAGDLVVLAGVAGTFRDNGTSNGVATNVTAKRRDIGSQERQITSKSEHDIGIT